VSMSDNVLPDGVRAKLFKNHIRGAILLSTASFIMWLFAVLAFWVNEIQAAHFIGISCSVLFLIVIIPLSLLILKRITQKKIFDNFSIFIDMLVVVGFTGVIYSLGGFEAIYLTPVYAALITYLGVMASKKVPFIIAGFCAFAFGSMVSLEGLGIIPSLKVDPNFMPSMWTQFIRVAVVIGLLFIVAYVSSFAAGIIKRGRKRLRQQNKELEEKTIQLEDSQSGLKKKNEELQNAINEIETLKGTIPICSYCHNIRDDEGAWHMLEEYISGHSDAKFSHGICPTCLTKERDKIKSSKRNK